MVEPKIHYPYCDFLAVNFLCLLLKQKKRKYFMYVCSFVLFGLYIAFNNLSVISGWCLDMAGS